METDNSKRHRDTVGTDIGENSGLRQRQAKRNEDAGGSLLAPKTGPAYETEVEGRTATDNGFEANQEANYVEEDVVADESNLEDEKPEDNDGMETASAGPGVSTATDEKLCRICYSPAEDPDAAELGRLISPCKCKGTMKYVHIECLNEWRKVSRNRQSFYECDHCHYRYNFRRTAWAKVVVNEGVVTLLTLIIFFLGVVLAGFLMKLFLLYYVPYPDVDDLDDEDLVFFLRPSSISLWTIDIPHLLTGLVLVGLLGFFQIVLTFLTGPWGGVPRIRTNRGDQSPSIVLMILVAIGVMKTMWTIYKSVRRWSRQRLEIVETAILDVHD
ncbi:hypothetical protein SpCBS45565_g00007 [Spizellomyces sp. 'palustris']|nr:hypothetical protein SpCBS45565_g00007 [Spizellomyces sp. 'palustris']